MSDASWDPGKATGPETTLQRLARRLAGRGMAGAIIALLLLRAEALAPALVVPLKPAKVQVIAVLCCAEMSWLFGGTVGVFLILQILVHEAAHLWSLQRLGYNPRWRGFMPALGPYLGLTPAHFPSREAEAYVALSGPVTGLALAGILLAMGQGLDLPAIVTAAKAGFLYNLIQMLPFRPLDGGRIFPGLLWRYRSDESADPSTADAASLRLIAACRSFRLRLGAAPKTDDADVPRLLAEVLVVLLLGLVGGLALARLLLPPMVFSIMLLAAFGIFAAGIAIIVGLDPRAVPQSRRALFAPRNGRGPDRRNPAKPLPWSGPDRPRAALAAYVILLVALSAGVFLA